MASIILLQMGNESATYVFAAGVIAAVIAIGSVAAAIKSIRGEIWLPFSKNILTPRRERAKKVDGLIERFDGFSEKLSRIEGQVMPNGGSSMRDTVNRIERRTEHISARIRHLDETNPCPIFEMDERGDLTFANAALCELLNADEGDLLHKNWISLAQPELRARFLAEIRDAVANRYPIDIKVKFDAGVSGNVRVRIKATPHVLPGGELRGFFGTVCRIEES